MIELFRYMYYRIASVAWNASSWGKNCYDGFAMVVLGSCLIFNILLIISGCLYVISDIYPSETIDFFMKKLYIPLMMVGVIMIPSKGKKTYKKLDAKYRNDKHKELKGWLIALYCIVSFFSFIVVSCIC